MMRRSMCHALEQRLSVGAAMTLAKIGLFAEDSPLRAEESPTGLSSAIRP
jgi:hypothetical protein